MYVNDESFDKIFKEAINKIDIDELVQTLADNIPKILIASLKQDGLYVLETLLENKKFKQAFFDKLAKIFE